MSSLDDIKKKLNIDEMDRTTRKEMFHKFVEKGGEVIKEKATRSPSVKSGRVRTVEINKQIEAREEEWKRENDFQKEGKKRNGSKREKKAKYPFSLFFKGVFQGYFTLSGNFHKKHVINMEQEFEDVISTLSLTAAQIVRLEEENKWKMIDFINSQFSLSYELILRIYDLYKLNIITEVKKYFKTSPKIQCASILKNILSIYKELIIILPYWETNKDILWKALLYYEKMTHKPSFANKNKINKSFDRLFNYYLPLFHITLQYNIGETVPFEIRRMKEFAEVTEEEDVGIYTNRLKQEKEEYLKEKELEKEEQKKKLQEAMDQKEMEKIPLFIQKGLKVIDELLDKKESRIKNDKKLQLFEPNEKMLLLYILYDEFDKHYSFLLTTSQLKLTTRLENGVRTDIRAELDNEFINYNNITNYINEYMELLKELADIKIELQNNPIQEQIKINSLATKRISTFNEIKLHAGLFFKEFAKTLQKLINDYKGGEKLLLQNPEDTLSFQLSREKNRFDSLQIIKAIVAAYTFTSALHYYLTVDEFSQKNLYYEKKTDPETESFLQKKE